MKKPVLLYTDIKSPYAFVARSAALQLSEDYEIDLRWLPYTLNIPEYLGSVEGRNAHQWRRVRYSYMDARRFANKQGLILRGPQKIFDTRPAHIGMLYAAQHEALEAYLDLAFELFWKREFNVEDVDAVAEVLARAGIDSTGFAAFAAGPGETQHDRIISEAEAAGVFGVPTYVIEGELFWGGDRLPQVRERLDELGLSRQATGSVAPRAVVPQDRR